MGIRHVFPIHFNSNGFGGAALYQPLTTVDERPWPHVRDCSAEGYAHAHLRYPILNIDPLSGARLANATCNADGLTVMGRLLIKELVRNKITIDIDHMSAFSTDHTLTLAEGYNYPVVSGHTGFVEISMKGKRHEGNKTPLEVERVRRLGGLISVIPAQGALDEIDTFHPSSGPVIEHTCGNSSQTFAQAYLYAAEKMQGGPVAIGTDFNGLAGLPSPRFGSEACSGGSKTNAPVPIISKLKYPFPNIYSGTTDKSRIGNVEFDFNFTGLAHIGMLPDLVADMNAQLNSAAGISSGSYSPALNSLLTSAEGYIKMWEKIEDHVFGIYVTTEPCSPLPQMSCGDGTPSRPHTRLDAAISDAGEGEHIFLKPGVYKIGALATPKRITFSKWPGMEGAVVITR
jgi:microsomal dipeptidase-like Zn-dependent dipeptidase